jgi:osmotically inducible protein OsmC
MATQRTAAATWSGDLASGSGDVTLGTSKAASGLGLTWKARTEDGPGKLTSPEELIAAALAGCFSMALSNGLSKAGHTPDRLEVSATSNFEKTDAGFRLTTMDLHVRGTVPGIDEQAFRKAADEAAVGCPVSNALKGNVDIRVDAALT